MENADDEGGRGRYEGCVNSSVLNCICASKIERFVRMCVSFIIFNFSIHKLCVDREFTLLSCSHRTRLRLPPSPHPPQAIFINIQIYFDLHLILPLLTLQPQARKEARKRVALSFPGIAVALRIFTAFSSIIAC